MIVNTDNPDDARRIVLDPSGGDTPDRGIIRARAVVPCRACRGLGGHETRGLRAIPPIPSWIPCSTCDGAGCYRAVVVLEGHPFRLDVGGLGTVDAIEVPAVVDPDRSLDRDRGSPALFVVLAGP